jgi:hypothetical protein
LTNATGFVEHLILVFLLLCLAVLDTMTGNRTGYPARLRAQHKKA